MTLLREHTPYSKKTRSVIMLHTAEPQNADLAAWRLTRVVAYATAAMAVSRALCTLGRMALAFEGSFLRMA